MKKPVIFSGIQPTGTLHVGNYLGAVKQWIELQNSGEYDCYFCVVDYHSLTGNMGAAERRENIRIVAAELLALGLDPNKITLFVQSHVPEHTELNWIFSCVTPVVELERMTQFKDKSLTQKGNINAGLFTYPVLQAADILLYHGTHVPVGEDQVQHVELTRNVARWFNARFGEYFPETKPLLTHFPRVMSLLEPEKKMSKSKGEGHVLNLLDEPDVLKEKLRKAVTATSGGKEAPGVRNLLLLLKEFGPREMHEQFTTAEKNNTIRYGELKDALADAVAASFHDFREKRARLLAHPEKIDRLLRTGAKKARAVAEETMAKVRELAGL